MEIDHWRDAISIRLAVPLPYLALGPSACCCHDRFDRRSGAIGQGAPDAQRDGPRRRRGRRRPKPVDPFGTHEQKCPHAFSLGRHDEVQNSAIKRKLNEAGKHAKLSTVRELRADSTDRSQRKGDLTVSELSADGVPTIADVRWNHLPPDRHLPNPQVDRGAWFRGQQVRRKEEQGLQGHH